MANDVKIDLQLQPTKKRVRIGDEVNVTLFATPDHGNATKIAAMRTILTWDATIVKLTGVNDIGSPGWAFAGFRPGAV